MLWGNIPPGNIEFACHAWGKTRVEIDVRGSTKPIEWASSVWEGCRRWWCGIFRRSLMWIAWILCQLSILVAMRWWSDGVDMKLLGIPTGPSGFGKIVLAFHHTWWISTSLPTNLKLPSMKSRLSFYFCLLLVLQWNCVVVDKIEGLYNHFIVVSSKRTGRAQHHPTSMGFFKDPGRLHWLCTKAQEPPALFCC